MKKTLTIVVLGVLLAVCALAQTPRPAQGVPAGVPGGVALGSSADLRAESFDIVWTTVRDKHFDPTLGGVDWNKVREQYAPRAAAAKSDSEFYGVLQQMLGELHQSHFGIIPPEAIVQEDSHEPKGGGIGIDLRLVEGLPMITRVDQDSTAAAAGLRPGFIIKQVGDTSAGEIIGLFAKSTDSQAIKSLRITRTFLARINGAPETSVRITYVDQDNQSREATIQRARLKGEMSERFGNFPPQYMEFEATRIANNIGYIRFNIFVIGLLERIKSAIRGMSDASGIIIDVRGNPGGLGGMAAGIAGVLEKKQTSLGTMHQRVGHVNFAVFPQPNVYSGPVVIVTDGGSASTSEIFAAGLQELGRAVVVGERTAGAALPSIIQKLPTGALFQYAIGDFKTPKGTLIEGRGVIPDVEVKFTRRSLLDGRDVQLEAAIGQITKQSR
ncbi:MAG TPA: S41 family peptidase [Blastocatellia bacterium]|nr:S41 family peptidase [Blastocatellia bacterium]